MASINGFEVKGVKFFPDHEGAMIPMEICILTTKKLENSVMMLGAAQ